MTIKEKFFRKIYRQFIKADFKPGDQIILAAFAGGISYSRPRDFLKHNRLQRILEIAWFHFVLFLFGFGVLAFTLGWPLIYERFVLFSTFKFIVLTTGVFLVWIYSIYMTGLSLGYLRWMWRNLKN